jgi:uncharacterized protein (UPF0210 family)
MAGAFHGIGEPDCVMNVGVSGPGVVLRAIEAAPEPDFGQLASRSSSARRSRSRAWANWSAAPRLGRLGVPFGIVDLSLAPTPGRRRQRGAHPRGDGPGARRRHGSTAALALLNDAVKKGGAMASSHVGGLSGAFIPVSEDIGMIEAAELGASRSTSSRR